MNETFKGLVERKVSHIAQGFGDEAGIQKVHAGMLRAADVHVYGKHFIRRFFGKRLFVVVCVGIAEIIPGRANERIQRIGIAPRFSAADGAGAIHEFFAGSEGGFSVRVKFHVVGKPHGKIFFGNGHDAAFFAVNHRDRRAPIALTGYRPVTQAIIDLFAAFADFRKFCRDRVARFFAA